MYKKCLFLASMFLFVPFCSADEFEKVLKRSFEIKKENETKRISVKKHSNEYRVTAEGCPLILIQSFKIPDGKKLVLNDFEYLIGYHTKLGVPEKAFLSIGVEALYGKDILIELFGVRKQKYIGDDLIIIENFYVKECFCNNYSMCDKSIFSYIALWLCDNNYYNFPNNKISYCILKPYKYLRSKNVYFLERCTLSFT